jgi:hypothetical protein
VVATSQGARALHSEEATAVRFSDYGYGRLQNGRTVIRIDQLFAETVNLGEPYHVFTQLNHPECEGLAVVNQTPTSFEVIELRQGRSNAAFSYRIVAKRRGYEQNRLDHIAFFDADRNLFPEIRTATAA